MEPDTLNDLAGLIRAQRIASLGTLRDGVPLVTMVLYAFAPDFSALYLHLSQLAPHTQAVLAEPRLGLMIAETDLGAKDPQTLARVSIQGQARRLARSSPETDPIKALYLARFPESAPLFTLGDFDLYRVEPQSARWVRPRLQPDA
jgi:putative heme iron utilization protein